ncbi:MAG: hypothetical protein ABIC04_00140 [Nanoarchaeota archaeon]
MHKKANIEISTKTLIGFILVIFILLAFVGFFMKVWGIFADKPNQATLNSFKNLVIELNDIKEGETRIVPFYVEKDLYLKTKCERELNEYRLSGAEILNDICICTNECSKKRLARELVTWIKKDDTMKVMMAEPYITYDKDNEVRNLKIVRSSTGAMISST